MRKLTVGITVLLFLALAGCQDMELRNIIADILARAGGLNAPGTPDGLNVGNPTITSLSVGWTSVTEAASYQVFRDTSPGGAFATVVYDGTDAGFTDTGLTSGITYHYKVQASSDAASSELSADVPGTTLVFLYVANASGDNVSAFTINAMTGALTAVSSSPYGTGTSPMSVAVDPSAKFLYVANWSGTVSAFTINDSTGALTPVSSHSTDSGTLCVAVDPSGKFLYTANLNANNISAFTIDGTTGALTPISGSPFTVAPGGNQPYFVAVHPSGKFLYVANLTTNNVSAFAINAATGALNELGTSPFPAAPSSQSLAVDPSGKWLFVGGVGGQNVCVFFINGTTGALSQVTGSPFILGAAPWFVAVDPSGKFFYAADVNQDNVTARTINGTTGELSVVSGSPFTTGLNSEPRSVAVDPSGRFLYTADYLTNKVSAFTIDSVTGALTELSSSPFTAGANPMSVITTRGY